MRAGRRNGLAAVVVVVVLVAIVALSHPTKDPYLRKPLDPRGTGPRGLAALVAVLREYDADVRIVLGKLRSHPTSVVTLSLDAGEGLCARHDEGVWFDRHVDRETAVCMALDAFPPHVALLDAWDHVPDGLLGMLGTDTPLTPRRLYASRDAVSLDVVAARHTGATGHGTRGHTAPTAAAARAPMVSCPSAPMLKRPA